MNTIIPHNRPTLGVDEEEAALKVIRSGWVAQGSEVKNFEDEFCEFLNIRKGSAVAVSSGTAALFVALLALNAKDKNVSIPLYTCSALINATVLAGGRPQLIDSKEYSPNINIANISLSYIAIIPHMYGIPQKIRKFNGAFIEDCAQALGAFVDDVPVGLQGDVGVFSFYATKLITAGGQGGMVVSKNSSIIEFIKDFRQFDQRNDRKNRFNIQMTDLQAAIGRVQLRKLPQFLKRREEIFIHYKEAGLPLLEAEKNIKPAYFRAILRTSKQKKIIEALENVNIKAAIPMKQSELQGLEAKFPNALYWTKNLVSLPIYPTLTDKGVEKIISTVSQIV